MFGKLRFSYYGKKMAGQDPVIKVVISDLCHTVIWQDNLSTLSVINADNEKEKIIEKFQEGAFDKDPRRVIMV